MSQVSFIAMCKGLIFIFIIFSFGFSYLGEGLELDSFGGHESNIVSSSISGEDCAKENNCCGSFCTCLPEFSFTLIPPVIFEQVFFVTNNNWNYLQSYKSLKIDPDIKPPCFS